MQQYVASIAGEAQNSAFYLKACADDMEKCVVLFSKLTSSTNIYSAKTVEASFRTAQKQLLIAVKALVEASKAGSEWSGVSDAQPRLILKPRGR